MKHTIFITLLIASLICSTSSLANATPIETRLTAPDAFSFHEFGGAVAIDGNTAVVGAPTSFIGSAGFGSAYVYIKTTSGWQFEQKLTAFDGNPQSFFGVSVDIDGDTIVVGSHGDMNAGAFSGAAYVFVRSNGTWLIKQKLTSNESSPNDSFGLSVGIDGNTIVCGAFGQSPPNSFSVGTTYVFTLTGNQWLQSHKLTASDAIENNSFGARVAIDANTIVIGAIGSSQFAGAVYVFEFDGSTWHEQEKLTAHDAAPRVNFGYRLGVSGDTIVVASQGDATLPLKFSTAYIFRRTPSGWHQQKKITTDDVVVDGRIENMGRFGLTVAVSGDTVVVGSPNDPTRAFFSGSAYIYKRNGESNWSLDQQIFPSDAARDDHFAFGVAITGNTILLGAVGKSTDVPFAGAAYIYEF